MKADKMEGVGMTSPRTRARLIQRLFDRGIQSKQVLDVMQGIPRHLFIDEALSHRVYEDLSLPIGYNQSLSKPYTVARMTEILLQNGELDKVLEVGTGSGYQTVVLAHLVKRVFSVERIKDLYDKARSLINLLSLNNIQFNFCDGSVGWTSASPFDGIIVTAAPIVVPEKLLVQLSPDGGRMVVPVGEEGAQKLLLIVRDGDKYKRSTIESVNFVPMLSGIVR